MPKKPKKPPKKPLPKTKIKMVTPLAESHENKGLVPERVKKTRVRVIGIGGGGGSIVSEIASRVEKATFVAANTDRQALKTMNRNVLRFQFGEDLTGGLGTGMNTELGEIAAQNEKERIKKLFQDQDFCILIASLGGGVGSGAAPNFAKTAKNLGIITLGVFTLPFKFEGEKKMEVAKAALLKLRPYLNAIIILPNERIFQIIEKSIPLKDAFSAINKNLAESLEGLIETIYMPGLINIDFADLKTILQGQGRLAFLNAAEMQVDKGGQEYIKKVINSPLYPYNIRGAKGVLFNIAGDKILSLSDVSQISKTISELVNPEAKIIFGICQNKRYQDKIKVTLLATGCATKIFSGKTKKPKVRKKKVVKLSLPNIPQQKKEPPKLSEKKPSKPRSLGKMGRKTKKTKSNLFKIIEGKLKRKKVSREPKEKEVPQSEPKEKTLSLSVSAGEKPPEKAEVKVRKNALQVKKEAEELEREFLEKEKIWETPAFLRKIQNK